MDTECNKKIKEILASNTAFRFCFALLLIIYCLRFIGLDKDLPPYGVGGYNPTDEGVYSSIGLNLYNYGSFNPEVAVKDDITVTPYTAYHIRSNIVENMLVYYGLRVFGDNYNGFRAPMVFVSFVNFALILGIVWALIKEYSGKQALHRWLLITVELFYVISFPYLISSRVVEPTLVRLTFALFAYYVFLKCKSIEKKYFLTGLIITSSLQFAYITNVFFYIPIFVCGCLEGVSNGGKAFRKSAVNCILGCALAVAIGAVYYYLIWGSDFITNTISVFRDFSTVDGYSTPTNNGLKVFVAGILDFWGSNAFLFCLPLLFAYLMLMPSIIHSIIKNKNTNLAFATLSVLALFVQTVLITNDYIFRKAYLILPFVVFSIIIYLLENKELLNFFREKRMITLIALTTLSILIIILILWYRFFTNRVGTAHDFTSNMKAMIIVTSVTGVVVVSLLFFNRDVKNKLRVFYALITSAAIAILNIYASINYVWLYNSYSEKELMVKLNEYNSKPIFGAYSYAFTLYNDILPVILTNEEQINILEEIADEFIFIDVSTDNGTYVRKYLDNDMFKDSRYTGIQTVLMPRVWKLNGKNNNFAMYEIELKNNISLQESIIISQKQMNKYPIFSVEFAKKKFEIDREYETLDHKVISMTDRYLLYIEKNNVLNQLFREYNLSDEEVDLFSKIYEESEIKYNFEGTLFPIYGSVYGDIKGNVQYPIYGNVYGSINGNINAPVYGDIYGNVYGDIYDIVYGEIKNNSE
ncbi:MAG: hypothetical protein IJP92_03185 [Lachnospiraceae bacterium]|nr:hypothetical protein [Lachnospiraceae bacterium]